MKNKKVLIFRIIFAFSGEKACNNFQEELKKAINFKALNSDLEAISRTDSVQIMVTRNKDLIETLLKIPGTKIYVKCLY